jgi:WD40 repeat protein
VFVYLYIYSKTLEYILEREIEIYVDADPDIMYFFGNDMIATGEYDEEEDVIKIRNAKTGSLIKQLDREAPVYVAFDQNRYMAVGYIGAVPYIGDIFVYDTEDNFKFVITLNHGGQYLDDMDNDKYMAFSQNTKKNFFISAKYSTGTVKVWDTETWTLVKQFTAHDSKAVGCSAFGQNNLVATSSFEGTIKIWNCDTWELVQTLEEKTNNFNEVVFTQNNMLVVLNKNIANSKIKIWCSESWSLVKQLESNKPKFCRLALSKSNLLAVGCDDGKILIFNTENWDLFQELESLFRITYEKEEFFNSNPIAFDRNDFLSSVTGRGIIGTWRKPEDMVFD